MISAYLIVSALYLLLIGYLFDLKKKDSNHISGIETFDVVVAIHEEDENTSKLLAAILNENIKGFNKLIVVLDGIELTLEIFKDPRIELVRLKKNLGKTKAQSSGIALSISEWILLLDNDLYWEEGSLNKALLSVDNSKKIWALPVWEKFESYMMPLQLEEAAIKTITIKGSQINNIQIFSSAALIVDRAFAQKTLGEFTKRYGWDMYLTKMYQDKLGIVLPNKKNILFTSSKNSYIKYLHQRSRWIKNGIENNGFFTITIGLFIFLSFGLDTWIILWSIFQVKSFFIALIFIWLIKMLFTFMITRKTAILYHQKLSWLSFLIGHLLYGLNIGIILIFLVLRRINKFVNDGSI